MRTFILFNQRPLQMSTFTQVSPMIEQKKNLVLSETSLAYVLSTVAALLAFLLGWLICTVAGLCRA